MAVVSCKLLKQASGEVDRQGRPTYRARFRITADSLMGQKGLLDGALSGTLASLDPAGETNHPLPNLGATYDLTAAISGETDSCAYVEGYFFDANSFKRNPTQAEVEVAWTPLEPGEAATDRTQRDPLLRPAKWHWESEAYLKPISKDATGAPIVNGANRSFDRIAPLEQTRGVHVARFNVANQDAAIALVETYSNAVNSTAWTYFSPSKAARTVVCRYARAGREVTECSNVYVPMEMAFAYADAGDNWDDPTLNEGYGHYVEQPSQTYGYATVQAIVGGSGDLTLQDLVVLSTDGGAAPGLTNNYTAPAWTVAVGDQVPLLLNGSTWDVAEPAIKSTSGAPDYALATDTNSQLASEPVLLRRNGLRLPEGMVGNFIDVRKRREVDFNGLNATLTPVVP